ncbi:MAG: hypothetical protein Q8P67_00285, partial [archaeon]|nr:hypothetical protein [archaeon]
MSRTELFILAAVATSLCVVFLIIGATGPQARDISTFSAYNCSTESPPPPVYNPEVCNGVKMGQGQTWVHQWQALDVLEE